MEIKSAKDGDATSWNTRPGFSRPLAGGRRGNFKYFWLEFDSFNFIERNLILGAIIELRGSWRLVRGDLLSVFEGATVLQISGNPGRSECMAAGGVGQGGSFGPPLDHIKHITAYHRVAGELAALFEGPEERPFLVVADAGGRDPSVQIFIEAVMAGHLMPFAAFLVESQP
jgi:hypothetical protein